MPGSSHVLVLPGGAVPANGGGQYTQRGSTNHFNVSYDNSLGAAGPVLADAVLANCEGDYAAMISYFGGVTPATLPVSIFVDVGFFGAYHQGCADTNLHVAAFAANNGDFVNFLSVAELDECFMAAQGKWNCGDSSGEGLSRVLATERYPQQLGGFASAPHWLDGMRPNWVDKTEASDRNYVSIGCATLFLNYLRHQLGFSWTKIVGAGAPTLAGTYTALTNRTDGWTRFTTLVASRYPADMPSGVTTDNIFPIEPVAIPANIFTTHQLLFINQLLARGGEWPDWGGPFGQLLLAGTIRQLASHIEDSTLREELENVSRSAVESLAVSFAGER